MIYLLVVASFLSMPSFAQSCTEWADAERLGTLEIAKVPEASGLVISKNFEDRVYHINDSSDEAHFFISKLDGTATQQFSLDGFEGKMPFDTEDLSVGPCSPKNSKTCLFVADIGDNRRSRSELRVVSFEEKENFEGLVPAVKSIRLKYPDGARNAEAFAVDPSGNWFIVTKEFRHTDPASKPARVYFITAAEIEKYKGKALNLHFAGELDVPALLPGRSLLGHQPTSMSIRPDGKQFALLTYEAVIVFNFELTQLILQSAVRAESIAKKPYTVLSLGLQQWESIGYFPNSKDILVTSESKFGDASIRKLSCKSEK